MCDEHARGVVARINLRRKGSVLECLVGVSRLSVDLRAHGQQLNVVGVLFQALRAEDPGGQAESEGRDVRERRLAKFRQNVARFRLYRLRFLQGNMRFAAFFKMSSFILRQAI